MNKNALNVNVLNKLTLLFSVYDVLTGKVVDKLDGHRACVRDASWHPSEHRIISTSVRKIN